VFDGEPAPPEKGHSRCPMFGLCLLWPLSPISAAAALLYRRKTVHPKTALMYTASSSEAKYRPTVVVMSELLPDCLGLYDLYVTAATALSVTDNNNK